MMVVLSEFIPGEAIALYDCWCDRQACRRRSLIRRKKQRSLLILAQAIAKRVVGDRYPSNHPIVMVEMDKIVSEKTGWVTCVNPTYKIGDRTVLNIN